MAARLTDLENEVEQLKEENDKLKENNPHLLLQGIYLKIFGTAIASLVSFVATELVVRNNESGKYCCYYQRDFGWKKKYG